MSILTSPKTYGALAALQAGDAVACAVRLPPIVKALETVGLPEGVWPVLPVVKAASAVGLASVTRFPALARLTTVMLTVYFMLAVAAHIRVKDTVANAVPAVSLLALFGAMAVKGPQQG